MLHVTRSDADAGVSAGRARRATIARSLQHRLGLAIALPTPATIALAGGGVVLTRDMAYRLARADKALAQAVALDALRSGVETTLLATLMEADTDAARRAHREFERDAMHLLGILDQMTEDEIVFVDTDERADEMLQRNRPAALREAVERCCLRPRAWCACRSPPRSRSTPTTVSMR